MVEDAISGAKIAPRPPALAITLLPLCLRPAGDGPVCSQLALLWYSVIPLFCEWAQQCLHFSSIHFSCSVMSDSLRPQRWQPTRLPHPWDSLGKNTGMGCHFLLQCMKSESEVAQSCPTLATPWTAAYQAPPSMGFSRQEYWSGVPLLSPMYILPCVK